MNMTNQDAIFSSKARNMSVLAALCVVLIHSGGGGMGSFTAKTAHQFLGWGLCTFAVPWFFFASGYFLAGHASEEGWWKRALKERARTLVLPYLLWCLMYVVFASALEILGAFQSGGTPWASLTFSHCLWKGFGFDLMDHPRLVPFWYVRALLVLVCVSPIVIWMLRKWRMGLILMILPLYVYCCAIHSKFDRPWFFFYSSFSLTGLVYFSAGILKRLRLTVPLENGICKIPSLCLWGLVIAFILVGRVSLYRGERILADFCWLLCIPPLVLGMWRLVPKRAWPEWLTQMAFPLFAIHYFAEHFLEWACLPLAHTSFWAYPARWVIVVVCSMALARFMRKFLPREASILFGGR